MASIRRISVSQVEKGTVILRFDRPGVPYSYYAQELPDYKVSELKHTLIDLGVKYVFIRDALSSDGESEESARIDENIKAVNAAMNSAPSSASVSNAGINEVAAAQEVHRKAKEAAKHILTEVRMGRALDGEASKEIVSQLTDMCIKSPDVFVNMSRLKDFDDYTFTHSVNVAILSLSIGKRLGMSWDDLNRLGLAALLHDVGKMKIPEEILNKPGSLTEEEFKIIRTHPVHGYDILKNDKNMPPEVIKAVRQHHEKSDGTGYPDGLKEKEISKYAKIISISDVYDAVTSERVYHKGIIAPDALKMLFAWSGKHFNSVLVKFFINLVGIYPAGTAVMLDSGEIAVVFSPNQKNSSRPKVILIYDKNKKPLPKPVMFDLASYDTTTGRCYKTILSPLNKKDLDIDTNAVINNFLSFSR